MTLEVVETRIRNRIIETLEWIIESEFEVPDYGFDELVNSWEDYVRSPLQPVAFPPSAFTDSEATALRAVNEAMDAFCAATPAYIRNEVAALALPEWAATIHAARGAHTAMMKRGKLSEDLKGPS